MSEEDKTEKVHLIHRSQGQLENESRPIVLEYKKRKKKKETSEEQGQEKFSPGLEDIQRMEGNLVRITQKTAKAISKGVDAYDHERERSSKEKKDGAIEDFMYNSAKAASVTLKEASDLPIDLAEMVNKKSYRKNLRKSLRRASKMIRMWQI